MKQKEKNGIGGPFRLVKNEKLFVLEDLLIWVN